MSIMKWKLRATNTHTPDDYMQWRQRYFKFFYTSSPNKFLRRMAVPFPTSSVLASADMCYHLALIFRISNPTDRELHAMFCEECIVPHKEKPKELTIERFVLY